MSLQRLRLILSDFHLGNGRHRDDGTINPLEDFSCDQEFVELLTYYDREKSEADLELVLNGDFFNMIQLEPSEQELGILTERSAVEKMKAILAGHPEIISILRSFNASDKRRIVFVMGNHDPQLIWTAVQGLLREAIEGELVFVDDTYVVDGVHIEHGHQIENIFRMEKERYFLTKGYPEPVLNLPWGVFFVKDLLYRLKRRRPYVDKVRPYGKFWRWCFFNDFFFGVFAAILYIGFIFKTRFSRLPLKRAGAFHGFKAIFNLSASPTLTEDAALILQGEDCKLVVLGHTHIPIHIRLAGGEYINPGTWNDVTYLDLQNLGHRRKLYYVLVELKEEGPNGKLYEWHGRQLPFSEARL
ncbi:MAG: metallophosphoesterase [Deltaproteobacteria bacterium]|nr:metallophosphoesterase [Deltaproteobacteria bacterium]